MADVEVFIGNLEDLDFKWEGVDWQGYCPERMSPFFPYQHNLFRKILDQITHHQLSGKQTDWGSWVAP